MQVVDGPNFLESLFVFFFLSQNERREGRGAGEIGEYAPFPLPLPHFPTHSPFWAVIIHHRIIARILSRIQYEGGGGGGGGGVGGEKRASLGEIKGGGEERGEDPLRDDEGCIALHICIGFFPSPFSTCRVLIDFLEKRSYCDGRCRGVDPPLYLFDLWRCENCEIRFPSFFSFLFFLLICRHMKIERSG